MCNMSLKQDREIMVGVIKGLLQKSKILQLWYSSDMLKYLRKWWETGFGDLKKSIN